MGVGFVDEGGDSHTDDLSSRVLSFPFLPIEASSSFKYSLDMYITRVDFYT